MWTNQMLSVRISINLPTEQLQLTQIIGEKIYSNFTMTNTFGSTILKSVIKLLSKKHRKLDRRIQMSATQPVLEDTLKLAPCRSKRIERDNTWTLGNVLIVLRNKNWFNWTISKRSPKILKVFSMTILGSGFEDVHKVSIYVHAWGKPFSMIKRLSPMM